MPHDAFELQRLEAREQALDVRLAGFVPGRDAPLARDVRQRQNLPDVILFEHAHVAARVRFRDRYPALREHLLQHANRREAPVINGGSRPIENDRLHLAGIGLLARGTILIRRSHWIPVSRTICSARPNDRVMPEPPTAVTMRTPGAASIAT